MHHLYLLPQGLNANGLKNVVCRLILLVVFSNFCLKNLKTLRMRTNTDKIYNSCCQYPFVYALSVCRMSLSVNNSWSFQWANTCSCHWMRVMGWNVDSCRNNSCKSLWKRSTSSVVTEEISFGIYSWVNCCPWLNEAHSKEDPEQHGSNSLPQPWSVLFGDHLYYELLLSITQKIAAWDRKKANRIICPIQNLQLCRHQHSVPKGTLMRKESSFEPVALRVFGVSIVLKDLFMRKHLLFICTFFCFFYVR